MHLDRRPAPGELLVIAETLARRAGDVAYRGRRGATDLGDSTKSSSTDLVTRFDREAEATIVAWLRRHRPDDAIVGEEGTDIDGTSGVAWFIDPIDGTTNFVYDQPAWACSIGVSVDGQPAAGAVFAPALGDMFTAARGEGAARNGSPISVSGTTDASLALVATGFGFRAERRVAQGAAVARLVPRVRDIRRLGAAALDLCFVACGRLDAYFERHLNSWDIAAGMVIAVEAGAATSSFDGGTAGPSELLVAAPGVHAELVDLLIDAHPDLEPLDTPPG